MRRCFWWRKKLSSRHHHFVDSVKVLLSSGHGGDGASIMAHEHNNELAGPGGGNGGSGGCVFLRCNRDVTDLSGLAALGPQVSAGAGSVGFARTAHGRNGAHLWIDVPVGTHVLDADTNTVLFDLDEEGVEVLLLEGGHGGKGNAAFANRWVHSPTEATRGIPGNTLLAHFELKSCVDCALVGLPNAGKSSLLGAMTSCKPHVAAYPFTTLHPSVGVLRSFEGSQCRIADLPGLIEGAYENRGLGHQFLRHVERSMCLAIVVDMVSPYVPTPHGNHAAAPMPWDVVRLLMDELDYYSPGLSDRVVVVLANKMDVERDWTGKSTAAVLEELRRRVQLPVHACSARIGLELGANHHDSGLAEPIKLITSRVFTQHQQRADTKRKEDLERQKELNGHFEHRHYGSFRPAASPRNHPEPSARLIQHRQLSTSADDDRISMLYSDEGSREVLSLVDQQVGNVIGGSGFAEEFSSYDALPVDGQLHRKRNYFLNRK